MGETGRKNRWEAVVKVQERDDEKIESNVKRVDSNSFVGLRVNFLICKWHRDPSAPSLRLPGTRQSKLKEYYAWSGRDMRGVSKLSSTEGAGGM